MKGAKFLGLSAVATGIFVSVVEEQDLTTRYDLKGLGEGVVY